MADASRGGQGLLREVWAVPAYRRWSLTAQVSRLPLSGTPLAFILLATAATGNYRLGGVMVAAAAAAEVLFAAPVGRRLDRIDTVAAIVRLLLAAALTLALLAAAGALNLWGAILVALAVASSTLTAGVPAGLRRILTVTVPPRLLTPALALDGVLIEFAAVAGDKFRLGPILEHGTLMFGRRTWDHFQTLWPRRDDPFSQAMNAATKAVVTHHPVDETAWTNSRAIAAPLGQWVRREVATTDIVVIGSMSVAAELADQGLVDEYRLLTFPTVLDAGRGLFRGRRELTLLSTEQVGPAVLAVLAPEPEGRS